MTSSPLSFPTDPRVGSLFGRSYARSRLLLGINGVGLTTLGAVLLLRVPDVARWISAAGVSLDAGAGSAPSAATGAAGAVANGAPASAAALALTALLVVVAQAILVVMLDLFGGLQVVREPVPAWRWTLRWLRALAGHALLVVAGVLLIAAGAMVGGSWGAVAGAAVGQLAWHAVQGPLARILSGVRVHTAGATLSAAAVRAGLPPERVREVDVDDPAFVGGWLGWRGTLWVPARWVRELAPEQLHAQLVRRRIAMESGLRQRGVLAALLWNLAGVVTVVVVGGADPTQPLGVVQLIAGMTLWSFLGVLVLPTPSRHAVLAIDQAAARLLGPDTVRDTIRTLDARQDDEVQRTRGVETIFHPVPARAAREAALTDGAVSQPPRGAWHLTRVMLGSATLGGGLLGRVVHCNIGRPALWIVYPGD